MHEILESEDYSTQYLQTNAERVSLILLGSAILSISSTLYVSWLRPDSFLYVYVILYCTVGILYGVSSFAIFRGQRRFGIGLLQTAMLTGFAAIPFSFLNTALGSALFIGFGMWLVSILTLERRPQVTATLIGALSALALVIVDLFLPYPRVLLSPINIGNFVLGAICIAAFLFLFFLSFRAYRIETKLIVITVSIVLLATTIPILVITQSTRNALIESTETEIDLRGTGVSSEIDSLIRAHVDRLSTVVSNRDIISFIAEDSADLSNFDPQITDRILQERNRIWINDSDQFLLQQHFLFFSRLRNPTGDILRQYKQRFPETEEIFIVNKFGAIVAMGNAQDAPQYVYTDALWWNALIEQGNEETYIGEPMLVNNGQVLAIPIAIPINDVNNNLIGVIYTTYSVNRLIFALDIQPREDLPETNYSLVVGNAQLPLVPGQTSLQSLRFDQNAIDDLFSMEIVEQVSLQGNDITAGASFSATTPNTIMPNDWGVLVSRPLASVEEILRAQQLVQILIGLLLTGIGIFFARFLSRAVSAPIVNLANVAQELEGGDLTARAAVESGDEIGELSLAFNQMADQSQRLVNQLESRVAERTQALETSFQVSQTLSTITQRDQLVRSVVNQLQSAFDYYHVHIYLLDPIENRLRMAAGTGEVGVRLMEQRHRLKLGQGLVGRAAITNANILVPDVSLDPQWVANEFLPNTKSELAVPIVLGNEVLGVIDIQDDELNRFTEQDANLLRSIADQVAVALRNAEQFERAQFQANQEQQLNRIRERILRTQDVDSAMKTAAREISNLLGSKTTEVSLASSQNKGPQELTSTQKMRIATHEAKQDSKPKGNGLNGHSSKK